MFNRIDNNRGLCAVYHNHLKLKQNKIACIYVLYICHIPSCVASKTIGFFRQIAARANKNMNRMILKEKGGLYFIVIPRIAGLSRKKKIYK